MGATPSFVTGARILIKVGDDTQIFGVATNISTSATVVKPNVLGQYGPPFIQKLMQGPVTGSFTILKVLSAPARTGLIKGAKEPDVVSGSLTPLEKDLLHATVSAPTVSSTAIVPNANTTMVPANNSPLASMFKHHMDPARVLLSTAVDIDIFHRYPTDDGKFQDALLFSVKNCRLTSRSTSISPGSLVNESFNFTGLLLDDGSSTFALDHSGF